MSLRPLKFSDDIQALRDLLPDILEGTTEYSNEAELEDLRYMLWYMRYIWDVPKILRWLVPTLRDTLYGYVWEMEGEVVGMIVVDRVPNTTRWTIPLIAVLPAFRDRGIGTRLMDAGLQLIEAHGGDRVTIEISGENIPSRRLCERMGFEVYDGVIELDYIFPQSPPLLPLPDGYSHYRLGYFSWEPRYALARKITPEHTQFYEPLREDDFRRPRLVYGFRRLNLFMKGITETEIAIRTYLDSEIVARGGYVIRRGWGDISEIAMRVDPGHAHVAPYVLNWLINESRKQSRRRRIEMAVPIWQSFVIDLVEEIGFVRQASFYKMGRMLRPVESPSPQLANRPADFTLPRPRAD